MPVLGASPVGGAPAAALQSVYGSLAAVGGPAAGGLLIAGAGLPWTYGIDRAIYVASFVALWLLPRFLRYDARIPRPLA